MYSKIFKGAPIGNQNAAGKHKSHPGMHPDAIPRSDTQQKAHEKSLSSDNWHSKTMAAYKDKSNDSLRFIARDASAAAKAMPQGKKAGQYMDETHYANMELRSRMLHSQAATPPTKKYDMVLSALGVRQ